jgi:hypothetical protein
VALVAGWAVVEYLAEREVNRAATEWHQRAIQNIPPEPTQEDDQRWLMTNGFTRVRVGMGEADWIRTHPQYYSMAAGDRQLRESGWFSPPAWLEIRFKYTADKQPKFLGVESRLRQSAP